MVPKTRLAEQTRAEQTGSMAEAAIRAILAERGYDKVPASKFEAEIVNRKPIYSTQYPNGASIYGTELKADYVLWHPTKWPETLIIESKWQQTSGSADEKYPYLVMNIKSQLMPLKTIIVLDGGGYREGAKTWLKGQIGANLLQVFSIAEFIAWANRNNI